MKKFLFVFVPVLIVVLLGSCSIFGKPDYVGTWTATAGTAPAAATITIELTKTTFSVTVVTPVDQTVVTGDLADGETEATLDVTITGVSVDGTALTAAEMAAFLTARTLTADQSLTWAVTGETLTLGGALVLALTAQSTLTATLVP